MQIEVKSCGECPFKTEIIGWDFCNLNKRIYRIWLPKDKVHKNCPLKKKSVTVKIKE